MDRFVTSKCITDSRLINVMFYVEMLNICNLILLVLNVLITQLNNTVSWGAELCFYYEGIFFPLPVILKLAWLQTAWIVVVRSGEDHCGPAAERLLSGSFTDRHTIRIFSLLLLYRNYGRVTGHL